MDWAEMRRLELAAAFQARYGSDPLPAVREEEWRRLGLPTDGELERLARQIDETHRDQADRTGDWRSGSNRLLGLKGQRQVAAYFGLPLDTSIRKRGNRAAPFTLGDGTKVAVVTRKFGGGVPDLTVPWPPRTDATVWVLATVNDNGSITLRGWAIRRCWRSTARRSNCRAASSTACWRRGGWRGWRRCATGTWAPRSPSPS